MKLLSTWRVVTKASSRRETLPIRPPGEDTCELWYVDTRHAAVAALWLDRTLWLGGERAWVVGERVEALPVAPEGPSLPGGSEAIAGWYRVSPAVGARYVVTAGAFGPPSGLPADLESLGLVPPPGLLARLLGRAPPTDATALAIDVAEDPPATGLLEWIAALRAQSLDLSWVGNEGGAGLLHTFTAPRAQDQSVVSALVDQARGDEELAKELSGSTANWLDLCPDDVPTEGLLVEGAPGRGFLREVSLEDLAAGVYAHSGAWLDPGTPEARACHSRVAKGTWVVAQLRALVDEPAAISVGSAPDDEEAVTLCHLIGGVDRRTGALVGFVLTRAWT